MQVESCLNVTEEPFFLAALRMPFKIRVDYHSLQSIYDMMSSCVKHAEE